MGIRFSHCHAAWSYVGFNTFRSKLAADLGYPDTLSDMYENGTYVVMKNEDIYPLINHSDADGDLSVVEMQQIVPQLTKLVESWRDDFYYKSGALELIEGMKTAIERTEPMEFK